MTTIIKNATIVTGDNARTILYDSAIAIDGERIVAVGPTPEVVAAHAAAVSRMTTIPDESAEPLQARSWTGPPRCRPGVLSHPLTQRHRYAPYGQLPPMTDESHPRPTK